MKITRATTYIVGNPWKNWLFVRLDTDQPGLYGVGEGTLNALRADRRGGDPRAGAALRGHGPVPGRDDLPADDPRPLLRGRPDPHERRRRDRDRLLGHHRQGDRPTDLRPARRALPRGPARLRQRLVPGARTPESFAERAAEVVARGLQGAQVRPVRRGLADDGPVRPPALARHRPRRARGGRSRRPDHDRGPPPLQRLRGDLGRRALAEFEPTWFEEPTDHTKIDATAEVARRITVPVSDRRELHHARTSSPNCWSTTASTSCSPSRATWAASCARGRSAPWPTPTTPSSPRTRRRGRSPPRSASRSAPARRTCWCRSSSTSSTSTGSARSSPPRSRSSTAASQIPDAPGLGIDLNWAEVEKHPYQVSNFLPLFAPGWERREGARPDIDATDETA